VTTYLPHVDETVPMLPGIPDAASPTRYWHCPYCGVRNPIAWRNCLDCKGHITEPIKNHLACSICHGAWRNLEDVALCFFGHQEYVDWRKEQWKQVTLHIYPRLEKEES